MADAGLKAMVPFERPFLDYLLHNLAESGITRACIVIGPTHEAVREYYTRLTTRRIGIEFAIQQSPRGTADAVVAAEAFIGADHVLVVNGDNLYPVSSCRALAEHGGPALAAFSRAGLLARRADPSRAHPEVRRSWPRATAGSNGSSRSPMPPRWPASATMCT